MSGVVPRVLLLGGHGKVSLKLTPLLLAQRWNVTSVIRTSNQESEILELGQGQPGTVDVLISDLADVKSPSDAQKVLDRVKPDYVIWSAGAGGKGGDAATYAIDRDAAQHYMTASISGPSSSTVSKFLMVSFIASRRSHPPWWKQEDISAADEVVTKTLPTYAKAKIAADEYLAALAFERNQSDPAFQAINLRPGTLTDDEPQEGKVLLGKTGARGKVSRLDVARVAVELLSRDDTRGWYDLLQGDDGVVEAVDKAVKEKHDGMSGEDMERIRGLVS